VVAEDEQGRDQGQGQGQTDQQRGVQPRGPSATVDLVSVLYVVGGIPCLIVIFLILFLMTGACDQANIFIPV
jgi:hypothetical protein